MVVECRARDHRGIPESTDPAPRPQEGVTTEPSPGDGRPASWRHAHWARPTDHGQFPMQAQACSQTTGPPSPSWSRGWRPHGRRPHRHHLRDMRRSSKRTSPGGHLRWVLPGHGHRRHDPADRLRPRRALASGFPVLIYALAWLIVPLDGRDDEHLLPGHQRPARHPPGHRRHPGRHRHAGRRSRALHIGFVGIISWPVFLAAGLTILIWRNASERRAGLDERRPRPDAQRRERGRAGAGSWSCASAPAPLLAPGGIVVLILGHPSTAALRPLGGALLVIAAIVVDLRPMVAQPGPRPDVGARSAGVGRGAVRRWRRTCTTRCSRRSP